MKASKRFKQSMHDVIINQYGNGPYPSYYKIYFKYNWRWWVGDEYCFDLHFYEAKT